MAIATNGGHIARALDFYDEAESMYFIIGGNARWANEPTPDTAKPETFRLVDVVGLKKVENIHMVVPDEKGTIRFRDQSYKKITARFETTLKEEVLQDVYVIKLNYSEGLAVGQKLRINNIYESTIVNILDDEITLRDPAPTAFPAGTIVIGGALVEGAKYVYVDCYMNYDELPTVPYRQIGLCTKVVPNHDVLNGNDTILLPAVHAPSKRDEYLSLGILEVLDNRFAISRDISQRELLSLVIEF